MRFIYLSFFFSALSLSAYCDYFQQKVDYRIKLRLDDETHMLHAFQSFDYYNNSPDTLQFLYMHLWPNAYSGRGTALETQLRAEGNLILTYPWEFQTGFIDSLNFTSNGRTLRLDYDEKHPDIAKLSLDQALLPGQKITISTPFRVKIPSGEISRLGHIDQQYQITQWYPKPAVYDSDGWHAMPYLNQGEFYSEFGSFDVSISLPENYVLGATGQLQNLEELEWLDSLSNVVPDEDEFNRQITEFPASSERFKTLQFKAENVHDFAWLCDKRYRVMKSEVALPHTGRKVTTWAMFSAQGGKGWEKANQYLNDAIYYYSLWNGDYPYEQMTAVEGALSAGAGMEYPNITVIGSAQNDFLLEEVIMHETGHQWFYGILGSNERLHPWMDEGMNTYCEIKYMETKYPKAGFEIPEKVAAFFQLEDFDHYGYHNLSYLLSAKKNSDQAIELHSAEYSGLNYGAIVYSKTGLFFRYLQEYLGDERMQACLKAYFEEWKFKHPKPEDLKRSFEKSSGQDLSWFFEAYETPSNIDYKLKAKKKGEAVEVNLKSKASLEYPVAVSLFSGDSLLQTKWLKSGKHLFDSSGDGVRIDANGRIPDINRQNNQSKTSGLFKTTEPFVFKFFGALDDPLKTEIFHFPMYAYNSADGNMLGWSFYNRSLYRKRLEWVLAPMYAIHSNRLVGIANLRAFAKPSTGVMHDIEMGANLRRFSWGGLTPLIENGAIVIQDYLRFSPYLRFDFAKPGFNKWTNETRLRYVLIHQTIRKAPQQHFFFAEHNLGKTFGIHRLDLHVNVAFAKGLLNSDISLVHDFVYNRKGKSLNHRFFVGQSWENQLGANYNYALSGQSGDRDYAFDQLFLDRAGVSSFWSRQQAFNHGGMIRSFNTRTSSRIIGLNLNYDLPIPLGLGLFGNAVMDGNQNIYLDNGLYLELIPNLCTVYLPIMYLDAGTQAGLEFSGFNQIRFSLQLHQINPFRLIDSIAL